MNLRTVSPTRVALCLVFCMSLAGCSPEKTATSAQPSTRQGTASPEKKVAPADTLTNDSTTTGVSFPAQGTVTDRTRPPKPGSVPYKDALIAVHLTNVRSEHPDVPKEMVVYMWGMKDNKTTPLSQLDQGQNLSLTLKPWEAVEDQYGGYNRVELSDPNALTLKAYWGEVK